MGAGMQVGSEVVGWRHDDVHSLFFSREDASTGGGTGRHTLQLCQKGRPAGEEVPLQRSLS